MDKVLKFTEFEGKNKAQWIEKVIADLKGKPYESLSFTTDDSLIFEPFYTREELKINNYSLIPEKWHIRQDFSSKNTNKKILEALNGGVDSIGIRSVVAKDLHELLQGVQGDYIAMHFHGDFSTALINKINSQLQKPQNAIGTFDHSPIFSSLNKTTKPDNNYWEALRLSLQKLPLYKAIQVDVSPVLNNGGTTTQEIGIALAQAHEYLIMLLENDIPLETIARNIHFKFAIGSSYFVEIAKFRAFRWAWKSLLETYTPAEQSSPGQAFIHAETSTWNKSVKDRYNNMLRNTTEAMSAILGGADSVSVLPFDFLTQKENDFSLRMARNTLNILKEEAYFDAVTDIAGGSYYIEELTNKFAHSGWDFFKEIENQGGAVRATESGWITNKIKEEEQKKKEAFAKGEKVLLGVNKYPNNEEEDVKEIHNINRLEKKDA